MPLGAPGVVHAAARERSLKQSVVSDVGRAVADTPVALLPAVKGRAKGQAAWVLLLVNVVPMLVGGLAVVEVLRRGREAWPGRA